MLYFLFLIICLGNMNIGNPPGAILGQLRFVKMTCIMTPVLLLPGDKYELQTATPTTPSVVIHVCDDERGDSSAPDDSDQDDKPRPLRPKIIQTRRPDFTPGVEQ